MVLSSGDQDRGRDASSGTSSSDMLNNSASRHVTSGLTGVSVRMLSRLDVDLERQKLL